MKKTLILASVCAAMLASCDKTETVEAPEAKAISFANIFVDKSTRATDLTNENIADFGVYGFIDNVGGALFTNEKVYGSGTGDSADWKYDNTQYWTAGKDYWFSAIAPHTDAKWTYDANNNVEGGIITFENDGTQDLLYAYSGKVACNDPATQGKVAFTFNHLLSRVKFNFTNAMGNDNTTIKVTAVTITNANTKATCDVSAATKTWTSAADNTDAFEFGNVTADDAVIANGKSSDTDHLYLIPQYQSYELTFSVEVFQGDVMTGSSEKTVELPTVDMRAGNSYVFTAELNPDNVLDEKLYPIEFTVTEVTEWEEDFTDITVTLPGNTDKE